MEQGELWGPLSQREGQSTEVNVTGRRRCQGNGSNPDDDTTEALGFEVCAAPADLCGSSSSTFGL